MIKGWITQAKVEIEHGSRIFGVPTRLPGNTLTLTLHLANITTEQIEELKGMLEKEIELHSVGPVKQPKPNIQRRHTSKSLNFRG